jgi:hypothetical protein
VAVRPAVGGGSTVWRGDGGTTSAMGRGRVVGGVGGAESTEARWSQKRGRRGQRRGEIIGQAVACKPEDKEDEARWAVTRSPYRATGHVIGGPNMKWVLPRSKNFQT